MAKITPTNGTTPKQLSAGLKMPSGYPASSPTPAPVATASASEPKTPTRYTGPSVTPAPSVTAGFMDGSGFDASGKPVAAPSRYTAPVPTVNSGLTKPTLGAINEKQIREDTRKSMQGSIDAINANYANLITQEKVQGQDRAGQTRALNARSGTLGSDFGNAAQEKTTTYNKGQQQYLADQQNAQIEQVMNNIEDRATQRIQAAKSDALTQYQIDSADYKDTMDSAKADLQTLAKARVDLNTLDPAQKAALFKQAGYEPGMGELVYNAMKPKKEQIDYKFEKLADGQGLFYGTDPQTGELVTQKVSVDLPPSWDMTIAPDGTVIGFDKTTGESRMMSDQGQFAKPVTNTIGDLSPAQQSAVFKLADDYEKASGDFKTVTSNYNRVLASANNPSPAGDLSLIFAYMKTLDPTSVVREGEFATAATAGSIPDRIWAQYNKVINGERLNDSMRNDFVARAKELYQAAAQQQSQVDQTYSDRAAKFGIDPSYVIRDQSSFNNADSDSQLNDLWGNMNGDGPPLDLQKAMKSGGLTFNSAGNASASNQVKGAQVKAQPLPYMSVALKTPAKSGGNLVSNLFSKMFPPGSTGGQCGDFVRKVVTTLGANYPRLGDTLASKTKAVQDYGTSLANAHTGSVIVTKENPTYGHVAYIIGKNAKGFVVAESNFKQSNKVSYGRTIPFNSPKIIGVINPTHA